MATSKKLAEKFGNYRSLARPLDFARGKFSPRRLGYGRFGMRTKKLGGRAEDVP
jgi:hypothetical protein